VRGDGGPSSNTLLLNTLLFLALCRVPHGYLYQWGLGPDHHAGFGLVLQAALGSLPVAFLLGLPLYKTLLMGDSCWITAMVSSVILLLCENYDCLIFAIPSPS
jgi:hypothetical protein